MGHRRGHSETKSTNFSVRVLSSSSFPGAVPEWKHPPWLVLRLLSVEGGKPLWLVSLSPPDSPFSSPSAPFSGAGLPRVLAGPREGELMIQVHGEQQSPARHSAPAPARLLFPAVSQNLKAD